MDQLSYTDWQSHCVISSERLSHLFATKTRADCTFLVGSDKPETITAHKLVLAMSSAVFETMFYGSMPEGDGPIIVPDIQPEAFKLLLKFIYNDFATIQSYQAATELYCAARKYMIRFIERRCCHHILGGLTPQNACHAYEFANLFEEEVVLLASVKMINSKTKDLLKEGTFYDASIETVAFVFSQRELDIDSEVDLFKAAEKYAESLGLKNLKRNYEAAFQNEGGTRKKLKIEESDGSITEHDTTLEHHKDVEIDLNEDILKHMRKAISHIRFLTLSAQELASVASSTLLTLDEAFSLMLIVAGVNEPLPEGFCDIKIRRGLRQWTPEYYTPSSPVYPQQPNEPGQEATYEYICEFNVPNFKTRKRHVLCRFSTDSYQWKLVVQPDMKSDLSKTLSVYVDCDGPAINVSGPWRCVATVTLEITAHGKPSLRRTFNYTYTRASKSCGYRHWVPWTTLCEGYLYRNTFTIIARVAATLPISKPAE